MRSNSSFGRSCQRRGAVAAQVAVCLIALTGVLALAMDGGLLMTDRRHVQAAADAAALAAAADLFTNYQANKGLDPSSTARAAALANAAANGLANDGTISTVTVNIPPSSSDSLVIHRVAGYAEVIITFNQKRGFSGIFGSGRIPVKTRAVARGQWAQSAPAVLALGANEPEALEIEEGTDLTVIGGPVVVNSTDSVEAADFDPGSSVTGPALIVSGAVQNAQDWHGGPITTGVPPSANPLANLAPPDTSGLTLQRNSKLTLSSGNTTLQPGIYKGGISISGTASVTFAPGPGGQPGIFYMDGGGLSYTSSGVLTATGADASGNNNGVMIYNNASTSSDAISLTGSGDVAMTPPASGTYTGITLFQKSTSTNMIRIFGNSGYDMSGTIYAPDAEVQLTSSSSSGTASFGSQFIVRHLTVGDYTGSAQDAGKIKIDASNGNLARTRIVGLVE